MLFICSRVGVRCCCCCCRLLFLLLAVAAGGIGAGGYGVNPIDLSPRYAGVIMGIANTFGTIPGMTSPVLTGYLVPTTDPTRADWQVVFYISAGMYAVSLIVWLIWASGEQQV